MFKNAFGFYLHATCLQSLVAFYHQLQEAAHCSSFSSTVLQVAGSEERTATFAVHTAVVVAEYFVEQE